MKALAVLSLRYWIFAWFSLLSHPLWAESGQAKPLDAKQWLAAHHAHLQATGLTLQGPLVQGGLIVGKIHPASQVLVDGKAVLIDEQGQFIVGLDRDQPEQLRIKIIHNTTQLLSLPIARRDYQLQRIEGVAQKYVEPDPKQQARSRRDVKRVVAARKDSSAYNRFLDGFTWPSIGPISGVFGSQRIYNGVPRRPHYGVDIAGDIGTPVYAPAAGLVTLAEDLYFSGWTVIVDHGHYLSSSFLHLDKLHVQVGDRLQQGDLLGEIGATGRVTGPHLDWRMNWTGAGSNNRIDPQLLVPPMSLTNSSLTK